MGQHLHGKRKVVFWDGTDLKLRSTLRAYTNLSWQTIHPAADIDLLSGKASNSCKQTHASHNYNGFIQRHEGKCPHHQGVAYQVSN